MHQDMVQQVRHPGAFRLSSQPKGAVSAAQAIDDVSMKYQAVVHTHVNGLEQEGLAVMRIPEQSCPPLPSQVSSPPPSPPHLVAATQLGHSNLMSLRRRARLLRRTRRPSTPRSPLCTSNSPRERPSTSICGSSWLRRNSKGAPLCCRYPARGLLTASSCFAGLGAPRSCRSCRALSGLRHRPCQGVWCRRSAH